MPAARIGRRSFLRSGAATAAALWLSSTGIGDGEPADSPRDVLDALVGTILPFDDPHLPTLAPWAIADRIDQLFGLLASPTFIASLRYFNAASSTASFVGLDAAQRRMYLAQWMLDASDDRRRFYTSMRSVTYFAFYSLPEGWPAIEYSGPLIQRSGVPK